jgi:lipopolysaccharide export system permease protein
MLIPQKMRKINSIINRYVFRELLTPFILSVLFFWFLSLMEKMIEIANWIVNYNIGVLTVVLMIFYSTPYFLMYILPMSIMISVLLTFLRLSSDNEIIALKSGGHSLYGLLPPVLVFCGIGFVLTLFFTIHLMPWGASAIKELALKIAASNINIGLKERTFNDSFKDVMLYVNEVDVKNKTLIDVFIEDKREPGIVSTVIASKGKLMGDPDKYVFNLVLFNGTIHQTKPEERLTISIYFDTYSLNLDLQTMLTAEKGKMKNRKDLRLDELRQYIKSLPKKNKQYYKALLEYHRKFSIPFACIALGLLAMPLGVQSRSTKRSFSLVLALFFFLLYYLLLSAGMVFGKTGMLPPVIGMWLPNAVMGTTGLYFLFRKAKERPLKVDYFLHYLLRLNVRFGK